MKPLKERKLLGGQEENKRWQRKNRKAYRENRRGGDREDVGARTYMNDLAP